MKAGTIPERAAVSRHHARFERREDGRIWVVDNPSMNGTFVNGKRVREQALVAHDMLRIGDTLFRFVDTGIYGYGAYRIDGDADGPAVLVAEAPTRSPII